MRLVDKYPEHADLIRLGDQCMWAWDCFQVAKAYCNAADIHGWCGLDPTMVLVLREYALLQIAKTHDPKSSGKHANQSLPYVAARYHAEESPVITAFTNANAEFIESVRDARSKVIAHSDLDAVGSQRRFGAFKTGADDVYFHSLHDVMAWLYEMAGIGSFPEWPRFAQDDVEEFLGIVRSVQREKRRGER